MDFEDLQSDRQEGDDRERHWGKHRGTVLLNADPLFQGRIIANVPSLLGVVPTGWASPCVPFAGIAAGFYSVPAIGSGVWIEFEAGDISRPIWTGGYWGTGEAPPVPPKPPASPVVPTTRVWRGMSGLTVAMDDLLQNITLTDVLGVNKVVIDVPTGTVTVQGLARTVLSALQVQLGSAAAAHPAVLGDALLAYLTVITTAFNTHVHPGQLAVLVPVTPMLPVPVMPPPAPAMLSLKVKLE